MFEYPNKVDPGRQNRKTGYQSLEDDCDRRVMGVSTKFEMVSGKFERSEEVTTTQLVDGKYSLAPLYKVTDLLPPVQQPALPADRSQPGAGVSCGSGGGGEGAHNH